jgi:S1-C subfamily serine protease
MAVDRCRRSAPLLASLLLAFTLLVAPQALAAPADVVGAVMGLRAQVPPEARTVDTLGRERIGTGLLIDGSGLVVTIGYLILEAAAVDLFDHEGKQIAADIVAYDHDTGFGLVRARQPLQAKPIPLGNSTAAKVGDPLLVISRVGRLSGTQAKLVDRRELAGYWEYLLPDALLTRPPYPEFAGAGLIDTEGRLVGIGSLAVGDAAARDVPSPGNMFVPIDALKPILGDLLAFGRREGGSRPWLGVYAREAGDHIVVTGVAEDGPADQAGIAPGDEVRSVAGEPVRSLAEFYRKIWSLGQAGVKVAVGVTRNTRPLDLTVNSIDRMRWLKLNQSY